MNTEALKLITEKDQQEQNFKNFQERIEKPARTLEDFELLQACVESSCENGEIIESDKNLLTYLIQEKTSNLLQ